MKINLGQEALTLTQLRAVALGAAASQLTKLGYVSWEQSADDAFTVLDEMLRTHPTKYAAIWYREAMDRYDAGNDHQIRCFTRDWKRRCIERRRLNHAT